jgi:hypothetical protein
MKQVNEKSVLIYPEYMTEDGQAVTDHGEALTDDDSAVTDNGQTMTDDGSSMTDHSRMFSMGKFGIFISWTCLCGGSYWHRLSEMKILNEFCYTRKINNKQSMNVFVVRCIS